MRAAVLGDPIGHSLSPVIHRAAYAELGLDDWRYDAIQVPAGTVGEFLDSLDPAEWRGLSLTAPLKREAVPFLTSHDERVAAGGAVNTIVIAPDGSRHGLNTDISAAAGLLADRGPIRRAVVLGAGATAASLLLALAELGLESAVVVARDPARTAETTGVVARLEDAPELEVRGLDEVAAQSLQADLVVSTVPVSAQTPELVAALLDVPLFFDVVYDPWPTPLAAAAERAGHPVIHGLDLLVAQAAEQVTAMTGAEHVPVEAMRAAADRELKDTWSR